MNLFESIQHKTKISQIMNKNIISVDESVSSLHAAKMMEDTKVGSLIVLENGSPLGIVTDRDFAIKITAHSYPVDTPVRRIMSSPLISIDSNSDLWAASDLMSSRKIRTLPVIDNGIVVGIITVGDLMNHMIKNFKNNLN
jgi:CBS domain-containing protein